MFDALRRWRRQRVLAASAIPDALWRDALETLPFLAIYTEDELVRLRDLCVLFLDAKGIVGARGHVVTPRQRVLIAQQACVLVLNLDLALYEGFENIVVYPDEFVPGWEWEDEAGVVHTMDEPLAGEAMPRGPVVLSWPDVVAGTDWESAGMNLVIHEFALKIDMQSGDANGCPPLPADLSNGSLAAQIANRPYLPFIPLGERGWYTRGSTRLRADGARDRHRRRGAATARDGGDRRHPVVHHAHAAGAAGALPDGRRAPRVTPPADRTPRSYATREDFYSYHRPHGAFAGKTPYETLRERLQYGCPTAVITPA